MRAFRLALLIGLLVVTQVAVLPHLRVADVAPDLPLVVAIAVGYRAGPEAGALAGFAGGLGFGLFLETPLGLHALAFALAGYGVGLLEAGLLRAPRGLSVFLGALGGLAGGLVLVGIGVLAGVEAVKGTHGVVTVSLAACYDAVVAPAVFWLVARALGRERAVRSVWSAR
jgi:rod shape-determining protein MreD